MDQVTFCLLSCTNPSSRQSDSNKVKSLSYPKNFVDNSKSLISNLTLAPLTYSL